MSLSFSSLTAPPGGGQVRLVDFGSAFSASATDTAALAYEVQTLPYRAPEVRGPGRRARAAAARPRSAGARPCAILVHADAARQNVWKLPRGIPSPS